MFTYNEINIIKFPQSGFLLQYSGLNIYIDPFKVPEGQPKADLILVTHQHFDHVDPDSINKIVQPETPIVSNALGIDAIATGVEADNLIEIEPGEAIEVVGVRIETVPAYNIDKPHHPKTDKGLGFIVHLGETAVYHMGDTDNIPELKDISGINLVMVPVSGTYVMDVEEAVAAVAVLKPEVAIPMHHDAGVVGSPADGEKFKQLVDSVQVEILEPVV